MKNRNWLLDRWGRIVPSPPEQLVSEWGRKFVRLPGSARSEAFDPDITPWTRLPLDLQNDGVTRRITFVKPVQCGGSVVGEVGICFKVCHGAGGDLQYNWENDDKAKERWKKRIEKILKACPEVMKFWPQDRNKATNGLVVFPHCNLTAQGVFSDNNLDSDSIKYQFNEEIHNWEPGKLDLAYTRGTAFPDSLTVNISNAGDKGDQLHTALVEGTNRLWESPCPGCGKMHFMHAKSNDDGSPGGLRYDSEGCKRDDGSYNYEKLKGTIFYEFDCCGCRMRDDATERRKLAMISRYSEPTNQGAPVGHESMTLEAVAVYYIPWIDLIIEKHKALRAMKRGDPEPWMKYLRRRECRFWDPEERPMVGRVVLNSEIKKDRDGLKDRVLRGMAIDRQQGELAKGELPHWWVVIRDFDERGNSRLVFEGKVLTDEDVVDVQKRHSVLPRNVVVDSGDDTTHVYQFCLKHGYNAIKGSSQAFFSHENGVRRIFSVEKPLHSMIHAPATCADPIDEPQFWFYSKPGIADRLHWLRSAEEIKWEVPGDVSKDYQRHMEAEEIRTRRHPTTNQAITEWVQVRDRNDLLVCERYLAMLAEMAGLIAVDIEEEELKK